jgi:hypothetical protein
MIYRTHLASTKTLFIVVVVIISTSHLLILIALIVVAFQAIRVLEINE